MRSIPWVALFLAAAGCAPSRVQLGAFPNHPQCVVVMPFEIQFSNRDQKEYVSELVAFGLQEKSVPGLLMPKDLVYLYQEHRAPFPKAVDPKSVLEVVDQVGGKYVIFGYYSELPLFRSTKAELAELKIGVDAYLYEVASKQIVWTYSDAKIIDATRSSPGIQAIASDMVASLLLGVDVSRSPVEGCFRTPSPKKAALPSQTASKIPPEARVTLERLRKDGVTMPSYAFFARTFELSKAAVPDLYAVAEAMRYAEANEMLLLESHVDATSDMNADLNLSLSRGEAMKSFLMKLNVDAKRMNVVSHGGSEPKAPNVSKKSRELNRRIVLRLQPRRA